MTKFSFDITVFDKSGGSLSKRISLKPDGTLKKDALGTMARGRARRVSFTNIGALADCIGALSPNQAIALGALRQDLPDDVEIVCERNLRNGAVRPDVISRTGKNIIYRPNQPAALLLDFDSKGMSAEVANRLTEAGGFWAAVTAVLPILNSTARVMRSSTSAGLFRDDTGEKLPGSDGQHVFLVAQDGEDIERFLKVLHARCWLAGFGWYLISASGALLERSIVDHTVGTSERLVFEGAPVLDHPLQQDVESRRPLTFDGALLLDTRAYPPLTNAEQSRLREMQDQAAAALRGKVKATRAAFITTQCERLMARGLSAEEADRVSKQQCDGVLLPSVELPFDRPELAGHTVADVLADPQAYVDETLADPLEGVDYGSCKAKVLLRYDGTPFIHSLAHGLSTSYELKDDLGVTLESFWAYMPKHQYLFTPTGDLWPGSSINARIAPIPILDAHGRPVFDDEGNPKSLKANLWLDQKKAVEQMTWCPGEPLIIPDRLVNNAGWVKHLGMRTYNLYRPPNIELGDPHKAGPWLDHVKKVYPDEHDHLLQYFAQRRQQPHIKPNHGLVLGGAPGIGKDTMLEPVKQAIGPWNWRDISPKDLLSTYNPFARSVMLRINEVRDLGGEVSRYDFYNAMLIYLAAPPDTLPVNEKYIGNYWSFNCMGVVMTTNYKLDGIYLPANDRRHLVAWSPCTKEDFEEDYWNKIWRWYEDGGYAHVAAYLAALDLSDFDPKAPPKKTPVFWAIVGASRSSEETDLADLLEIKGNPAAVTIAQLTEGTYEENSIVAWLKERKNRRAIPHKMERAGYVMVNNPDAKEGRWKINGKWHTVYAREELIIADQIEAAKKLKKGLEPPDHLADLVG